MQTRGVCYTTLVPPPPAALPVYMHPACVATGSFCRMLDSQLGSPLASTSPLPFALSPLSGTPAFRAVGGSHVQSPAIATTDLPTDLSGSVIAAICNLRDTRGGKANPSPIPGSQIETTLEHFTSLGAVVVIIAVDNGLSTSALGGNSALAACIKRYRAAVDAGSLGHIVYMVHGAASHEMAWGLFQIKASRPLRPPTSIPHPLLRLPAVWSLRTTQSPLNPFIRV